MNTDVRKYFWSLNRSALKETIKILKDPDHRRFPERMVSLLSRCDKPKELFLIISKQQFVEAWPRVKAYWKKVARASDFRNWWQTVYEQISGQSKTKKTGPKGKPAAAFLEIGRSIRDARIKMGLSQNGLAVKVAMKQPDISMIEEGKQNITLDTLTRLCRVLEIKKLWIA